ncbi:MAG: hypothetical protein H6812_04545 [Phycisphaeraceae bacterium]|nr:hypothetical protein [Phycisphaeraceae bacterium]
MSDGNFSIMGALREGQANADSLARIGKDVSGIAGGLIKIAAALTLSTSFGVDMLLRHSFGTRYMSVRAWFCGVLGFMVFAAFFVPDEQGRSIEIVGSAILLAGPAHLLHWIVRVRKFRWHSGFPGLSWMPWHRVSHRMGYWLPLCLLDPLLACGVGWIITAMGYEIGWYFIAGGSVSSLRHTYYALGDRQRQIDQRDALIEAEAANTEMQPSEVISEPSVVTGNLDGTWEI